MNADPHGMNRPADAPWLTYLEQERPEHPRQQQVRRDIERAAWERTRHLRQWQTDLAAELGLLCEMKGHNWSVWSWTPVQWVGRGRTTREQVRTCHVCNERQVAS